MSNTVDKPSLEQVSEPKGSNSSWNEEEKMERIAHHFASIMETLGLDLKEESLSQTPRRVARMYVKELFRGLDPSQKPRVTLFENTCHYDQMIIEKDISFFSCCEHHFVPIQGVAHLAYLSSDKIMGLSKMNRIVHYCAARPQLQERLTQQIAAELSAALNTENVAVQICAKHFCVISRGVSDINSQTQTQYLGGTFRESPMREEFLRALH